MSYEDDYAAMREEIENELDSWPVDDDEPDFTYSIDDPSYFSIR